MSSYSPALSVAGNSRQSRIRSSNQACRGCVSKEDEAQAIFSEGQITADNLREMSDYHLAEMGLTPAARDRLLAREEFVATGAICICLECQYRLLEEQESSERCPK
jgi:hypothetical protein